MQSIISVYKCLECKEENHKSLMVKDNREVKYCCYCGSDKVIKVDYNYFQYEWEYIKKPFMESEKNHCHEINLLKHKCEPENNIIEHKHNSIYK